jgi:hypothetical protein
VGRRRAGSRVALVLSVALASLAILPTVAQAGVNNGGCPPAASNWVLVTPDDYYAQFEKQLQAGLDAGYTLEEIAAFEGVAPTEEAVYDVWLSLVLPIDKNGDGAFCFLDYYGFTVRYPWAGFLIDNVLPH